MDEVLKIEEKYSRHWVNTTVGLACLTILFLIIYSNVEGIVLRGYLKLIAFGGLAATVLSALKVMQGRHSIQLKIDDDQILLTYYRRDKIIHDEIFDIRNIKSLRVHQTKSNLFDALFAFNDPVLKMELRDSDRPLNFAEVNNRPLPLSRASIHEIIQFISDHCPGINIPKPDREFVNTE